MTICLSAHSNNKHENLFVCKQENLTKTNALTATDLCVFRKHKNQFINFTQRRSVE